MGGSFQTDRDIFDNPIWTDIMQFRVFFFLYGNARWKEEPVKIGEVEVGRGQILRSYRNLQKDLEYIENRQVKQYPISSLKRAIDRLVKNGRVSKLETEHGTLFTILNYEEYQGFERFETVTRNGTQNSVGTGMEQERNNKNKEKKEKKDKKYKYEPIHMELAQYLLDRIRRDYPDYKCKSIEAWANTIRLMEERDERKTESIRNCITWVTDHSFWKAQILSASNLREKYDRLMVQYQEDKRKLGVIKGGKESAIDKSSYESDYTKYNFR